MLAHPKKERSLVIIKPDGVQRALIGDIIQRFERTGLKFIAMKLCVPKKEQCWTHYNKDEDWFLQKGVRLIDDRKAHGMPIEKEAIEYGKDLIQANVDFFTSGPVLAFVMEGNQSVAIVKKIVGGTEPTTSDVGTIRGDLTVDAYQIADTDGRPIRNLIHASGTVEEAEKEIALWFSNNEILNYRLIQEQILYDVNLDGILE